VIGGVIGAAIAASLVFPVRPKPTG